ncbi:uncharacterized protein LOC143083531 [Mytilus galloprovincialis]|uniref:uncharacterized protein LOC143083531 n=1 Tax=Mytilus galloprovincialis TaxID=29158 RepID=UPI003F7C22BE
MRKMKEPKTMGTELDILAAAHFMQADIYTFTNNKWIKYSAHQIDKDVNVENEAIYLHHIDKSSHYAVVMNVEKNRVHNLPAKSKTIKDCTSVKCNFDHLSRNNCTDTKNNNTLLNETQVDLTDIRRKRRRELEKMRYCQNDTVRDKKKRSCKETYWNNAIYRSLKIHKGSMKYINDETYRQDLIEKGKMKYIHDLDYRLRMKKKGKLKYKVDEEYRDNLIEKGKGKYEDNETYRSNMIKKGKKKYEENETYRTNMIEKGKKKYEEDETYRTNIIEKRKKEYEEDEAFRNNKIVMGKKKYKKDETYRANMIEKRKKEYKEDETYRNKKIEKRKQKYEEDETYRANMIENGKKKYEEDEIYRNNMIEKVKEKRLLFKVAKSDIDVVVQKFKDAIKKGPEYVCACCLRLLFQNQVLECKCENYDKQLIQKCVTEKYVHKCSSECESNCLLAVSCRNKLWICYTCHRKLHTGLTPPESFCNNLQLEAVPDELCNLNKLESHLIALNIPFQKIMNLPKGNQAGIIGPVVLVPSDVKVVTNTLPRPVDDHLLVKVKLKRKLEYKGYVQYEFVDIKHLEKAFNYLRNHNKWYANIELNSQWMDTNNEQNDSTDVVNDSANDSNNVSDKTTDTNAEESYLNESLRGIQLDTCLQPADIGQEVLDCYFDEEFDVAPAEGNNPIRVLKEEGIESKTFPCHYPSGKNTLTDQRDLKLSASRYFNLRLLSVENRFARDTSYIFFLSVSIRIGEGYV